MSSRTNSILIDWLSITTKLHSPDELKFILGLVDVPWQDTTGMHGYRERYYYDGISIHYAGRSDMGVWLEMSGSGCRAFESYGSGDYAAIFGLVLNEPKLVHITRLDVAYDVYDDFLDIDKLCQHTLEQKYRSKMEFFQVIQSSNGKSLDIGSKASDVMIRIYDKLAERLSKLRNESDKEKIKDEIPHWVRIEVQMRDDRAFQFINLLQSDDIGKVYTGVLRNYLEYGYMREGDDGKQRFSCFAYWEKILDGAEALSIYLKPGTDYNLDRCKNYVFNSAGNAVDALLKIYGTEQFKKYLAERPIQQNPKYEALIKKHTKNGSFKP